MRLTQILLAASISAVSAFSADQALLNMVMPDARVIAGIDIERARSTSLGKKMIASMNFNEGDMAKFSTATGFDPRRDLREVIFASTDVNGSKNNGLMVVRGVFDLTKINSFLRLTRVTAGAKNGSIEPFFQDKKERWFSCLASPTATAPAQ